MRNASVRVRVRARNILLYEERAAAECGCHYKSNTKRAKPEIKAVILQVNGKQSAEEIKSLKERLCKASAEAKLTWTMPSRRQRCMYMNY